MVKFQINTAMQRQCPANLLYKCIKGIPADCPWLVTTIK